MPGILERFRGLPKTCEEFSLPEQDVLEVVGDKDWEVDSIRRGGIDWAIMMQRYEGGLDVAIDKQQITEATLSLKNRGFIQIDSEDNTVLTKRGKEAKRAIIHTPRARRISIVTVRVSQQTL